MVPYPVGDGVVVGPMSRPEDCDGAWGSYCHHDS